MLMLPVGIFGHLNVYQNHENILKIPFYGIRINLLDQILCSLYCHFLCNESDYCLFGYVIVLVFYNFAGFYFLLCPR
jgi:hypothetical protein